MTPLDSLTAQLTCSFCRHEIGRLGVIFKEREQNPCSPEQQRGRQTPSPEVGTNGFIERAYGEMGQ